MFVRNFTNLLKLKEPLLQDSSLMFTDLDVIEAIPTEAEERI